MEKLKLDNEELKSELESLEKYRSQWEQSINALKESESQAEYLKQLEVEVSEKNTKISKLKKDLDDLETRREEETRALREEIESLQMKNIELVKNESLVKMYKKKLDDLKDIKQSKRAIELERDNLRGEIEQLRLSSGNNKESKKIVEFYKSEIENYRMKVNDFEDALKLKNNEIVKLKNLNSKYEREAKIKDEKISALEHQLEEYLEKPEENTEEYRVKITNLEKQIELLKEQEGENVLKERVIMLEESSRDKDREVIRNRERIEELQRINTELEEEMDNLRNELSTINESPSNKNGEVHRASVEGLKRNQLERDLRKATQEKIRIDTELQKAKDALRDYEDCKRERNSLREQLQSLYNEKNDLQDKLHAVKEEKLQIHSKLTDVESELKSTQRELKSLSREAEDMREREVLHKKELDTLMTSQKLGGEGTVVADTVALLEKDKIILQRESELSTLKLEYIEKSEEYKRLKEEHKKIEDSIEGIKKEYEETLKKEKTNCKVMVDSIQRRANEARIQYENEQKILITAIMDIGYSAYKSQPKIAVNDERKSE